MTTIDVSIGCLAELVSSLSLAFRIIGSVQSETIGSARLVIEGENLPQGHCSCTVSKAIDHLTGKVSITYELKRVQA